MVLIFVCLHPPLVRQVHFLWVEEQMLCFDFLWFTWYWPWPLWLYQHPPQSAFPSFPSCNKSWKELPNAWMPWTLTLWTKWWLYIVTCMTLETKWLITLQQIDIIAAFQPLSFIWNTFHYWVTSLYVRGSVDLSLVCALAAKLHKASHLIWSFGERGFYTD